MLRHNTAAQRSSLFCNIPREILDYIWQHLSRASKVVLMLTCKHFAKMGQAKRTEMPPPDEFSYYWMLSKMASWMPRGLKLCVKCRMYRATACERYKETDWRRIWLQESWESSGEHTDEISICPMHRFDYAALCLLPEVDGELQPLPTQSHKARLPADGTGGLHPKLHYRLDDVAQTHPANSALKAYHASFKRRRSF